MIEVVMNHRVKYPDLIEKQRLEIIEMTPRSMIYLEKSSAERKSRESSIPAEDVKAVVEQIIEYPCMGGVKGSLKLIEDKRALIGETMYDEVKEEVRCYLEEEYQRRRRESEISKNSKARQDAIEPFVKPIPLKPHDVWSIDYMFVTILGFKFTLCPIYDLYAQYYCALGVGDTIGGEFARLTFEEAQKNTGHIPEKAQISDNDVTFVNGEFYNYLANHKINYVRIPKSEPWWNGELESGNRDLRHWVLVKALKGLVQRIDLTTRGISREEVLGYVTECCQSVRKMLNEQIPRVKFKTTPQNVCDNIVAKSHASQQQFIESKKQQRLSRMEGIKNGTIKTKSKTLLEKAKSALKKLVGKMSDNELFVSNELLHNRYACIIN